MDLKKYFYRTAVFTRQNNEIALADIEHPNKTTPLEAWMGTVLSLADGRHTVDELVVFMAKQYPTPPETLQQTIESIIERLLEAKLIVLADNAVELPYYLASPIEELDLDKAKTLIKEDGYALH